MRGISAVGRTKFSEVCLTLKAVNGESAQNSPGIFGALAQLVERQMRMYALNQCPNWQGFVLDGRFSYQIRGISAVGSARHSHCRGQGFESPILHHLQKALESIDSGAFFRLFKPFLCFFIVYYVLFGCKCCYIRQKFRRTIRKYARIYFLIFYGTKLHFHALIG